MINIDDLGGKPKYNKVIQPGNHTVKINSIEIDEGPSKWQAGSLQLVLNVESKPIDDPDFVGFHIDKDDHSKGTYAGMVGKVNAQRYSFNDYEGATFKIERDTEILKFIRNICNATGCYDSWFKNQSNKHETIDLFVEAFNNEKPFEGKWIDCCLSGREYQNNAGYSAYNLFFEKFSKNGIPFVTEGDTSSNLLTFNPEDHLVKLEEKKEFGEEESTEENTESANFSFSESESTDEKGAEEVPF